MVQSQVATGSKFTNHSPGYHLLPTLIGDKAHDPRSAYRKNPSYSFGIRYGKVKASDSPGPCHYPNAKILRSGYEESPKFSLYRRQQIIKSLTTPGPGGPISEKTISTCYPSYPAFSFGNCHYHNTREIIPGANCYKPPQITVKSSKFQAPSYTVKGLLKLDKIAAETKHSPGPGKYSVTDPSIYKNRDPLFSMTSRNVTPGDMSQKPGPGAHKVSKAPIQHSSPAYSFGVRHSENMTPFIVDIPEIECNDFNELKCITTSAGTLRS